MKKIYNFLIIIALSLTIASCDDFLDIQPTGKVIPRTAKEFREMMTQAYYIVPDDRGMTTFRSDEYVMDATLSKEDINSYKDIWSWNDVSRTEYSAYFDWRNYYQVLFSANYTIESKDKIEDGSPEVINQLVGESYMLRAYMHFILVNLYGEPYTACDPKTSKAIPLKLDTNNDILLSRSTVGEVYTSILNDLTSAESLLNIENWDAGFTYRFNKISVDALRSRVYLYMGNWEESLKASQRVLKAYNKLEDFSKFLPNDFQSAEAIVSLEKNLKAQYHKAGKVDRKLFALYESGDVRKGKYYKQLTASNIQALKGGEDKYRCTFRVGEIYLNAAEAALEYTGIDVARDYILTLMKARLNATSYATKENAVNSMSKDELRQEIYNERFRELAFEGHRWFDLRRTTRPALEKKFGSETYNLEKNDSRYTLRIPSEAIAANPNLAN